MMEKDIDQTLRPDDTEPQIVVNDYGATRDPAVVVEEPDRTVLLTDQQTIIIDKEPQYRIAPANRPRKVYGGMWGQTEIATVGLGVLALLAVLLLYLFLVVPSNNDLEHQRAERNRLETELISARAKYGDITSTESQVSRLVTSAEEFESTYLPVASTGKTALYQKLNGLIAAYGLVNTTGPDYSPLDIADMDRENQADQERGRTKFQSLFPGVYVTMTVEGPYHNLRRFIREIETGNEFVVISAIELEPSDAERPQDSNAPDALAAPAQDPNSFGTVDMQTGQVQPGTSQQQFRRPRGKTHGQVVSLRLEMAAYFKRANVITPETGVTAQ